MEVYVQLPKLGLPKSVKNTYSAVPLVVLARAESSSSIGLRRIRQFCSAEGRVRSKRDYVQASSCSFVSCVLCHRQVSELKRGSNSGSAQFEYLQN